MTNSCNSMYINIYNMFLSAMSMYKVRFCNVNPLSNKSLSYRRWYRENKSSPNQIKLYSTLSVQEYQNSFNYPFVLMKFSVVHIRQVNWAASPVWSALTNQYKLDWWGRKHCRPSYSPAPRRSALWLKSVSSCITKQANQTSFRVPSSLSWHIFPLKINISERVRRRQFASSNDCSNHSFLRLQKRALELMRFRDCQSATVDAAAHPLLPELLSNFSS